MTDTVDIPLPRPMSGPTTSRGTSPHHSLEVWTVTGHALQTRNASVNWWAADDDPLMLESFSPFQGVGLLRPASLAQQDFVAKTFFPRRWLETLKESRRAVESIRYPTRMVVRSWHAVCQRKILRVLLGITRSHNDFRASKRTG
jgi:hypothetical protein